MLSFFLRRAPDDTWIDLTCPRCEYGLQSGKTCLMFACNGREINLELVRLLLDRGANVNARTIQVLASVYHTHHHHHFKHLLANL